MIWTRLFRSKGFYIQAWFRHLCQEKYRGSPCFGSHHMTGHFSASSIFVGWASDSTDCFVTSTYSEYYNFDQIYMIIFEAVAQLL